jgi:hypothetical protein
MTRQLDIVDKIAMYVGGGLMVLAIPVMGILTTITGSMAPLYAYKAGEETGHVLAPSLAPEGAEIVSSPLVDPNLRAAMVLLALLVWGGCAVYKLYGGKMAASGERSTVAGTAD